MNSGRIAFANSNVVSQRTQMLLQQHMLQMQQARTAQQPMFQSMGLGLGQDSAALDSLRGSTGELMSLAAKVQKALGEARFTGLSKVQSQIDDAVGSIRDAYDPGGGGTNSRSTDDVSDALKKFAIFKNGLAPGVQIPIDVTITQSAQAGALFMGLAADSTGIDLGDGEVFKINVSGSGGSKELSFASGATLSEMAEKINEFTGETGVVATASAGGLSLKSSAMGGGEFVSVQIIDDGSIQANGGDNFGIYRVMGDNTNMIDPGSRIDFTDELMIRDSGQDIGAMVNGEPATTAGTQIMFMNDMFGLVLDLFGGALGSGQGANAQNLGTLNAFMLDSDDGVTTDPPNYEKLASGNGRKGSRHPGP